MKYTHVQINKIRNSNVPYQLLEKLQLLKSSERHKKLSKATHEKKASSCSQLLISSFKCFLCIDQQQKQGGFGFDLWWVVKAKTYSIFISPKHMNGEHVYKYEVSEFFPICFNLSLKSRKKNHVSSLSSANHNPHIIKKKTFLVLPYATQYNNLSKYHRSQIFMRQNFYF